MPALIPFEVKQDNGSFTRRPTKVGGHVRVFSAATAELHSVPTDSDSRYSQYVLFSSNVDFWVIPITSAEENLVLNGTFTSDTSWTKGTGWTIAAGVGSSDASQSAASFLTQNQASSLLIEGQSYSVAFTVSGYSAGNVRPVIGGTAGTNRASSATFTETIIAGSTQAIALEADADFVGNVDTFTVTPIAIVPAADITAGGAPDLNPTGYLLGGVYTKLSIIPAAAGVVGMQFYK